MVALAVKRQTGLEDVCVTHNHIYLGDSGEACVTIPLRVTKKMRNFDQYGFVLPFSFELMLTETEAKSAHGLCCLLDSAAMNQRNGEFVGK